TSEYYLGNQKGTETGPVYTFRVIGTEFPTPTATIISATSTKVPATFTPKPTNPPVIATPRPNNSATAEPEATPTKIATPELVKTWPEKLGNMATDKIEIYNHGKEMGVYSTDWGELVYLAKKLANIGNVKVKGYEFHFYDWNQTNLIPTDPSANYDQTDNWGNRYPGSPTGKHYWKLRPDGILEVHMTLPKILDNYTGAGKTYVLNQLNHDTDARVADELCGKGDWKINRTCDSEVSTFARRSLPYEKGDFSNLKIQFPTSK
ncbi:MAG: hypothetical protein Q7K26_06850, partial [bacterium]|nr:hypothetical protein [bacterium]